MESLLTRAHVLYGKSVHDHLNGAEHSAELGQEAERQRDSDGGLTDRRQVRERVIGDDRVEQEALVCRKRVVGGVARDELGHCRDPSIRRHWHRNEAGDEPDCELRKEALQEPEPDR